MRRLRTIDEPVLAGPFPLKAPALAAGPMWHSSVERARGMVQPAFDALVDELLTEHLPADDVIVEIGAGSMSLPREFHSRLVRLQPLRPEYERLREKDSRGLLHTDVASFCAVMSHNRRRVRGFFALNVFDTMSDAVRRASAQAIQQVQNHGDRVLLIHDANALLLEQLEQVCEEHPGLVPMFVGRSGEMGGQLVALFTHEDYERFVERVVSPDSARQLRRVTRYPNHALPRAACGALAKLAASSLPCPPLPESARIVLDIEDLYTSKVARDLECAGYEVRVQHRSASALVEPVASRASPILYRAAFDAEARGLPRALDIGEPKLLRHLERTGQPLTAATAAVPGSKRRVVAECLVITATRGAGLEYSQLRD